MNKNLVITLLSMLLVIAVTVIAVTTWKDQQKQIQEQEQVDVSFKSSTTIDDRIEIWKIEKDWDKSYNIYLNLPEEVLRKILVKVGTEADAPEIAYEYLSNINYYVTSLIKDKIQIKKDSIPGVDSVIIQLEALKVNKEENIPITAIGEDK